MSGISGPSDGLRNSTAWQSLELLRSRRESGGTPDEKKGYELAKRLLAERTKNGPISLVLRSQESIEKEEAQKLAKLPSSDPRSPSYRSPVTVLSEIREGILAGITSGDYRESIAPNGNGFFSPGHLVLNDSDTEMNFAEAILAQVNGDDITLNAASHAVLQVNGQNSTVNVGGAFSGQLYGDNSTVNVTGDALLRISGDSTTANVAGTVDVGIHGDDAVVNAAMVHNLYVSGDNATVNTHTLAGLHRLYGEDLTVNAEVALGDVRLGTATYFDTIYGREATSGSGSGDIKLNIGTVEGRVSTGDGNDTLIIGTASSVGGGRGDDVIKVENANVVRGGKGDDQIEVGAGVKEVVFAQGDGHDIVRADSGTSISFHDISKDKVRISAEDGTYRISFEGSDDTIELRTQDGATSRLTFGSILDGVIELKDGKVTYV